MSVPTRVFRSAGRHMYRIIAVSVAVTNSELLPNEDYICMFLLLIFEFLTRNNNIWLLCFVEDGKQANISFSDNSWARRNQVLGSCQQCPHSCPGSSEVCTSCSHSSTRAFWKLLPYGIQISFQRRVHSTMLQVQEKSTVGSTQKQTKGKKVAWATRVQ